MYAFYSHPPSIREGRDKENPVNRGLPLFQESLCDDISFEWKVPAKRGISPAHETNSAFKTRRGEQRICYYFTIATLSLIPA